MNYLQLDEHLRLSWGVEGATALNILKKLRKAELEVTIPNPTNLGERISKKGQIICDNQKYMNGFNVKLDAVTTTEREYLRNVRGFTVKGSVTYKDTVRCDDITLTKRYVPFARR